MYCVLVLDEVVNFGEMWILDFFVDEVYDCIDFLYYVGMNVELFEVVIVGESCELVDIVVIFYFIDYCFVVVSYWFGGVVCE